VRGGWKVPLRSIALGLISLALLASAGCRIVLPPDSASPGVVLNAYLGALQAGDCDAASRLATPGYARETVAFCGGVRVTAFSVYSNPAILGDNEIEYGLSLTTSGGDETLPDGSHTWFYSLVRPSGGPWRVEGGGGGP
jgi:hypothetical protein